MLIVDDVPAKRLWMRALLEGAGHQVVEAENGLQALEKIRTGSFSVVVTDINMPEMNGIELIHRLRDEAPSELRILAVSAGTSDVPSDIGLQGGQAVGADAILYMPCSPAEFLEAVARLRAS